MAWKDTAMVLPGGYIDILVDMSNLGEWMLHCHISEHLHAGMMMPFRVESADGYATGDEFRASLKTQAPAGAAVSDSMGAPRTFAYSDTFTSPYSATVDTPVVTVLKDTLMAFSFKDSVGNAVNLNNAAPMAIRVTFVKSDGTVTFTTYPGNTAFPAPAVKASTPTQMPASDGHDHMHFLGIKEAYAHGDVVDDGHHAGAVGRTYSIPARFPEVGQYKGFVEFILEGESTPRITTINVTVDKGSWSVDNYGWSREAKWWILFLISLAIMIPLSFGVRKYVNEK